MNPNATPLNQARMLRVVLHIEAHLDDELHLDELAALAGLSPFHFHRIFHHVVGAPPSKHIRRLRLERVAQFLKFSDRSVTDLVPIGFESREGFTRAFAQHFGQAPTVFRAALQARRRRVANQLTKAPPLVVHLQEMPPRRVALARIVGNPLGVARALVGLGRWGQQRGLLRPDNIAALINHDDEHVTPWRLHRLDGCLGIPDDCEPDPPLVATQLPAGWHAVAEHTGGAWSLIRAWNWLCEYWLPNNRWQPSDHRFYNLGAASALPRSNLQSLRLLTRRTRTLLCIPVQPHVRPGWPAVGLRAAE